LDDFDAFLAALVEDRLAGIGRQSAPAAADYRNAAPGTPVSRA
jgi:hypothetical protein